MRQGSGRPTGDRGAPCAARVAWLPTTLLGTLLAVLAAVLPAALTETPGAAAHESTPADVQRLELSLGAHQLVVTITRPPPGGGRSAVTVVPRGPEASGTVAIAAVPRGAAVPPGAVVAAGPAGRAGEVTLDVPVAGDWEVTVADGTGGGHGGGPVARIPLAVAAPTPTPAWVWALRVAALVAVVALVAAVAPATRRRGWPAVALGGLAVAGAATAVTLGVVGPAVAPPLPAAPADHGAMAGMTGTNGMEGMGPSGSPTSPGAVVATARTATAPVTGSPIDLVLDLTDGASGAVVDDLAVHDDALVHLAVVGPGQQLVHVHPVRVAPGRYVARMTPGLAGRYGVAAEMERGGDGGHQVARTAFDVGGSPAPAPPPSPPAGPRAVAGMQADVSLTPAAPGRPVRVAVRFTEAGRPVTDLQPWLGMAGHLMVLGPGVAGAPDPGDPASAFGHVHDMSPPNAGRRHGPEVRFDLAFPRAGRYQLWAQVQRDWQVVTVPVSVDVPADTVP